MLRSMEWTISDFQTLHEAQGPTPRAGDLNTKVKAVSLDAKNPCLSRFWLKPQTQSPTRPPWLHPGLGCKPACSCGYLGPSTWELRISLEQWLKSTAQLQRTSKNCIERRIPRPVITLPLGEIRSSPPLAYCFYSYGHV